MQSYQRLSVLVVFLQQIIIFNYIIICKIKYTYNYWKNYLVF